ncbi:MAG: 2,3-bisphosphoglycerate-independent phosphoglycerate mutase [Desulfobacteraceae bacterium]|nr:2,3-bisphosphoglycerate-independent phosphoglycerate mutase [Desulfobacteraceae bacterium]
MTNRKPFMLIILDGWGHAPAGEANAVSIAKTPFLDRLMQEYPNTHILCSGEAVGLPRGIMGNSEVGHLNIGAGRIVYQDLLKIDMAVASGEFAQNDVLNSVMNKTKENNSALHLMGLVSDGGVHSQLTHLFALLDMARDKGLNNVYVHAVLDGRDTPPDGGVKYTEDLQKHISANRFGKIASICGRFYAMDRDKRWDRVERAFHLYTQGRGTKEKDPVQAVKNAYLRDETDEFVSPVVMTDENGNPFGTLCDRDGVIFFNFRADRAREITAALTDPDFDSFERESVPKFCDYVCMTQYDEKFDFPVAFPRVRSQDIFGEIISRQGLRQLRIAETEKYAHVTYFFNGGEEETFPLEDRCLIPSPREVATYDLKPEMSAPEVTREVISRLESGNYDVVALNFANMDMVGHTGIVDAAVIACETVDKCLGEIVEKVRSQGGVAIVTADHGNAEKMKQENGNPHTAHTLNPVPLILVDDTRKDAVLRSDGILADIAPTILHIMGIDQPEQMTGKTLM